MKYFTVASLFIFMCMYEYCCSPLCSVCVPLIPLPYTVDATVAGCS
jgi:hypothetical protein